MSKTKTYEPMAGDCISDVCETLEKMTAEYSEPVQADFNGVTITAKPGMTADDLEQGWLKKTDRMRAEYQASPEYKERQKESARRNAEKKASLQTALVDAPPMEFADESGWKEFASNNTDPYGGRVVRYADEWARLMQRRIADGETVESCADDTSHLADDDGITGFMHGCALSVLVKTWKHGEALRRWYNVTKARR